jgi:hypothetical protein
MRRESGLDGREKRRGKVQQQIPFGDDNQKKDKGEALKSPFPSKIGERKRVRAFSGSWGGAYTLPVRGFAGGLVMARRQR